MNRILRDRLLCLVRIFARKEDPSGYICPDKYHRSVMDAFLARLDQYMGHLVFVFVTAPMWRSAHRGVVGGTNS